MLGKGGSKSCYLIRFKDADKALLTLSAPEYFKYERMIKEPASSKIIRRLGLDSSCQYELVNVPYGSTLAPGILTTPFQQQGGVIFELNGPSNSSLLGQTVNIKGHATKIESISSDEDYRALIDTVCKEVALLEKEHISMRRDSINLHLTEEGVIRLFFFDFDGLNIDPNQCTSERGIKWFAEHIASCLNEALCDCSHQCSQYLQSLNYESAKAMIAEGIKHHLATMGQNTQMAERH
ncbi:hypothetical protein [Sansalvadorimonas verongulae]|uniref:hypothetical protein n=1 Tax=Sansalvadorimonas verongulae TaxID=2172824 RepID=UPI0018AD13C6|nr:hypothetical protein [Sansalvadorimonas verongulae]MTI15434.1 hypothetical protein [Sansalvadorimonas verongulae]